MNGKIRVYFPKRTNFHNVTQEQLDKVAFILNSRPRKSLGWISPIQFIQQKCCTWFNNLTTTAQSPPKRI